MLGVTEKRSEAFKLWCCRRLMKVSWVNRVSNEETEGLEKNCACKICTQKKNTNFKYSEQSLVATILVGYVGETGPDWTRLGN